MAGKTSRTSHQKKQKKLGRPPKGYVKVLVSLEREEAEALAKVARVRGLFEGKRGEVSELIRDILSNSDYWVELRHDLLQTLKAINSSELARSLRDQVFRMHPRRDGDAAGAALRAGLAGLLKDYDHAQRLAEPALRAAGFSALLDGAGLPSLTPDKAEKLSEIESSYRHLRPALIDHLRRRGIFSVGYDGTFVPVDNEKKEREAKERDPNIMSDQEIADHYRKLNSELLAEPVGVSLDSKRKP